MMPIGAQPDRYTTAGVARWIACVVVILTLHVAALLSLWHPTKNVAEPAIPSAVLLELAPEPAAPSPPPPQPVVTPTPPRPAEPPPEPAALPEPPARQEPPSDVTLPEPPPIPPPARPPRPRSRPAVQRTQSIQTPETHPVTSAAPVPAAPAPNQALMTWQGALRAHLALFKRYPVRAQRRGDEGVAEVRFVMDHSGRVLSVVLVRGSGHTDLDQEALAWIQRAQPLPPPPPEMGPGPLELVIPLRFELH